MTQSTRRASSRRGHDSPTSTSITTLHLNTVTGSRSRLFISKDLIEESHVKTDEET